MTIYTANTGEKKAADDEIPPVVVTEAWPSEAKEKKDEASVPVASVVAVASRRRGRHNIANVCIIIASVVVLALGIVGGVYLYNHLTHRTFRGWCGVRYVERDRHGRRGHMSKHIGKFEEEVEIDQANGQYEKINVPAIDECRRATILHDFSKNYTAIIDKDSHRCFVMSLNRTMVSPPRDFWDLIRKLKSGYYMPDARVIRQYYHVEQPPVKDLSSYGIHIRHDCRWYTTYKLVRINPPRAMTKRSTSKTSKYSMGVVAHVGDENPVMAKINLEY